MKIKKKFGDKVDLTWLDACEVSGWKSLDDALKIPDEVYCKTRGYFLGQDKDFVTIAHTIGKGKNNDTTGIMHIPKKWLLGIK